MSVKVREQAFVVPAKMRMEYRVTRIRVICLVYEYLGDNKYAYGASIYRVGDDHWSLQDIKKKIRVTACGRAVKNPVFVTFNDDEMNEGTNVGDLIRNKFHTLGVCGQGKSSKLTTVCLTPNIAEAILRTII